MPRYIAELRKTCCKHAHDVSLTDAPAAEFLHRRQILQLELYTPICLGTVEPTWHQCQHNHFCCLLPQQNHYCCLLPPAFCQAYYYTNELTQESSWDAPIAAPGAASAEATYGTLGGDLGTCTPSAASAGVDKIVPDAAGSLAQPSIVSPDNPGAAAAAGIDSGCPFYINERGNRVFCVPPRIAS